MGLFSFTFSMFQEQYCSVYNSCRGPPCLQSRQSVFWQGKKRSRNREASIHAEKGKSSYNFPQLIPIPFLSRTVYLKWRHLYFYIIYKSLETAVALEGQRFANTENSRSSVEHSINFLKVLQNCLAETPLVVFHLLPALPVLCAHLSVRIEAQDKSRWYLSMSKGSFCPLAELSGSGVSAKAVL